MIREPNTILTIYCQADQLASSICLLQRSDGTWGYSPQLVSQDLGRAFGYAIASGSHVLLALLQRRCLAAGLSEEDCSYVVRYSGS